MIQFTQVEESQIPQIDQLNSIGENYWKSEFFHPFQQPSYLIGCTDKNDFMGSEGYIGYHLIYGNKLTLTHRVKGAIVNPKYRGQGIFEKLIKD